jgi:hypothetical protein
MITRPRESRLGRFRVAWAGAVAQPTVTTGSVRERTFNVERSATARTFLELADTLVDDCDVVELLTLLARRCVEMLGVDAAGLMLVGPRELARRGLLE